MEVLVKTVNGSTLFGKLLSEDLNILVILNKNNVHYMVYKNNVIYVQKFNGETVNNIKEVDLLENLKDKNVTVAMIDGEEFTGTLKQYYKDKIVLNVNNATYEIYKHGIVTIIFR